jgi:thymidylate synthase (FAD)
VDGKASGCLVEEDFVIRIVNPSAEILHPFDARAMITRLEEAGRTCYKSEERITPTSASKFVKMLVQRGHHSVLEHETIQARIVCDRGVSHELVRHRTGVAFSQESTRYCNYAKRELAFIRPPFWLVGSKEDGIWRRSCEQAATTYLALLAEGAKPEEARSVLPNSLKTEVVMTANLRAWKHILDLRTSDKAHPQMREVMMPILRRFRRVLPEVFGA